LRENPPTDVHNLEEFFDELKRSLLDIFERTCFFENKSKGYMDQLEQVLLSIVFVTGAPGTNELLDIPLTLHIA
jgi:hypothetical protein